MSPSPAKPSDDSSSHAATEPPALAETAFRLERMERMELIGRRVRLSDGREGPIVHVEYESPERVALIKTQPVTPSPLTRAGVDRLSPGHLPYIVELLGEPSPQEPGSRR